MIEENDYILIVEDNLAEIELYKRALHDLSNKPIVYAHHGEKALELICKKQPFLILSDLNMPKMDGLELLRNIKENKDLALKSVPFIFLSNSASPQEVKDAYSLSAQGYFQKPIKFLELKQLLSVILKYWNLSKIP